MKKSIKVKLQLTFTGIFVLLTLVICLVWYKVMGDKAKDQAVIYFRSTVDSLNEEFDNLLKDTNYISLILSFNAEDQSHILTEPTSIDTYRKLESDRILTRNVNDFYSYRSYIASIMLYGINERAFSNGVTLSPQQIEHMAWFPELESSGGDGVFIKTHSNYPAENKSKGYVISVGRKLWASDKHIGYLLVDISYDYINNRLSKSVLEGSTLMIMDEQGGLVYDSNSPKSPGESIYDTPFREVIGSIQGQENQTITTINGAEYMVLHKRSEFTDWITVCLMPVSGILKDVNKALNMTILISIACLIAGIFLIGGFSKYLTRNIMKLKGYVDHMDAGNLKEVPVSPSGDETEALGISFNHMIHRVNQLMIDLEDRKQRERQAEFQALYAQISPHFLSNTLNTISWMADRQNAGNISQITTSLITLLHYSMKNKDEVVMLKDELEYIKNYLVIQEYRYYGMFDVKYQIEVGVEDCRILKFMIQPMVENSIMHGISKLEKAGNILISAKKVEDNLRIIITDNGVGFSEHTYKQHKTHHIGIDNVRERIELFYGAEYFLNIESKENHYTKVTIELPFVIGGEYVASDDCR